MLHAAVERHRDLRTSGNTTARNGDAPPFLRQARPAGVQLNVGFLPVG